MQVDAAATDVAPPAPVVAGDASDEEAEVSRQLHT